jgi:CubicO group peptidase (beta-lactamase class C family)
VSQNFNTTLAAGIQDHVNQTPLKTDDIIPLGSVMKGHTAMAVMRLVDQKIIGLNDTVAPLVDDFLMRTNGTNLLKLFNGDRRVLDITVYHLLHMKAGLDDYDDHEMTLWTLNHPNEDFSPLDYLHTMPKTLLCNPGDCEYYSSNGYEILGFILAQQANATSWETFDWWSTFPEGRRQNYFNETLFLEKGKCSSLNVTHQYMGLVSNEYPGLKVTEYDILSDSCLNGWGFGNIAATALDVAKYYFEYFGSEHLLSYEAASKMMDFEYMDSKSFNISYGVGLTPMVFPSTNNISSPNHPYPNYPEN